MGNPPRILNNEELSVEGDTIFQTRAVYADQQKHAFAHVALRCNSVVTTTANLE